MMFYDNELLTDPTTTNNFIRVHNFWPRGPDCPLVFCDIVGREGGAHSGNKKSSVFSKCNEDEANKVVCIVFFDTVFILLPWIGTLSLISELCN